MLCWKGPKRNKTLCSFWETEAWLRLDKTAVQGLTVEALSSQGDLVVAYTDGKDQKESPEQSTRGEII